MRITYFTNYAELSAFAAGLIIKNIEANPDLLLCAASGGSPLGIYQNLADRYKDNPENFKNIRVVKLDEWGGIPMDNEQSCEIFLQKNLVQPLEIPASSFISFNSNPLDKQAECERIGSYLKSSGPIDVCILGLGLNGHIAFNEPGEYLVADCHITNLSVDSMKHPMALQMGVVPSYGLTIGLKDILQSAKIILVISGKGKTKMFKKLLAGRISPYLPASFLWLHPDTECLVDSESISNLNFYL
jgi:galactosamine-6-phosphate isomerase